MTDETREERRSETVVRDIPAELWIKILSGLAAVTLLLGSFIGVRAIERLDQIGNTLAEVVSFVQVHSNDISTLKANDEKIEVKVEGINTRVFKLEGLK